MFSKSVARRSPDRRGTILQFTVQRANLFSIVFLRQKAEQWPDFAYSTENAIFLCRAQGIPCVPGAVMDLVAVHGGFCGGAALGRFPFAFALLHHEGHEGIELRRGTCDESESRDS